MNGFAVKGMEIHGGLRNAGDNGRTGQVNKGLPGMGNGNPIAHTRGHGRLPFHDPVHQILLEIHGNDLHLINASPDEGFFILALDIMVNPAVFKRLGNGRRRFPGRISHPAGPVQPDILGH